MAGSDRLVHRGARVPAALVMLLASACGQITGLSDDYHYDLDTAGGGQADASAAGDGAADAAPDAGERCTASEGARADRAISEAAGEEVPQQCRTCMASSCCDAISRCAQNADCAQSMKCIFNCQRTGGGGGGKNQCLNGCKPTFTMVVGACVQDYCAAPTCQLE